MNDIGVFTPEQARALWQDYQRRQQLSPHISQNYPQRRPIDEPSPHRVFVKNTSSETCPAFGCMKITGVEVVGETTVVTIDKPDSADGEFLFNSQFAIEAGDNGWAFRFGVVIALGNGTPPTEANVSYQPVADSWTIEEGGGFFTVFGEHNVVSDAVIGRFEGGTGGAITIRFRIVAAQAYCMDCYATARIISGPTEVTDPDTLPGTTYDYEAQYYTIRVYDMGEGWLNYPPEDLLNMIGHATWLRSYEDGPCSEEPGLHWEIIDMQDPEVVVCE